MIHEYDWMGRRIRKQVYDWVASAWSLVRDERFLYDGWNVVAILNSPSSILQTQLWGSDLSGTMQGAGGVGGLLALAHYPSAKSYFAGYDGNGNVTVLIDGVSGLTEGHFEYGPFGELIRSSGTAAAVCPWRFSTKYEDGETGQLYYGYRFYNPNTGRWLSRDPIEEGDGPSMYAFVFNSPKNLVDRNGRESWGMSGPGWSFQYQNGQWIYIGPPIPPPQPPQQPTYRAIPTEHLGCCTDEVIAKGEKWLNNRFKQAKADAEQLGLKPVAPALFGERTQGATCKNSSQDVLMYFWPTPPCWRCHLEERNAYSVADDPSDDRLDHQVVICAAYSADGTRKREIMFDWWGDTRRGTSASGGSPDEFRERYRYLPANGGTNSENNYYESCTGRPIVPTPPQPDWRASMQQY